MTALHFITPSVYPYPGGMQESVLRIARGMAACGFECFIYTLGSSDPQRETGAVPAGVEIVPVGEDLDFLLDPLVGGRTFPPEGEENRAVVQCLTNAVRERQRTGRDGADLIISFYASHSGFLAQHAAMSLGLPHIASVRGSDFARDVLETSQHWRMRFVVEHADQLVTTNQEQAEGLYAMFSLRRRARTIHNSIEDPAERPYWECPDIDRIRLFSDCGFSLKKGTHLLLRAVESLVEKGLPVELTVLGGVFRTESEEYWEGCRRDYLTRHPDRFAFPGHRPRAEVSDYLRKSHLYCSATFAEGCSLSRIRALTVGIPIVTTRSGALVEVVDGCDHVRLCSPGDWKGLAREIEKAVADLGNKALIPDRRRIDGWRSHFSVDRERKKWLSVVEGVLPTPAPVSEGS